MTDKPVVLVTRRLPDAVHARLQRDYRPRLNLQDQTYSADDLMALSLGAQAIIPCPTDRMDSE
ncbi:MAG: D-glycerate dehydrogenase, partial [Gammaproteobacteria bacterium]|nr:D-glycerate dehydrogenase [Gammaproteobacteria bacterium]